MDRAERGGPLFSEQPQEQGKQNAEYHHAGQWKIEVEVGTADDQVSGQTTAWQSRQERPCQANHDEHNSQYDQQSLHVPA